MDQVVQQLMVLHEDLRDATVGRDLVGETPAEDTWMMVVLGNEFSHLRESVLSSARHVRCDIRDLRPDQQALFIAEIIEVLCVLIVSQSQRCDAELFDQRHVFFEVFL